MAITALPPAPQRTDSPDLFVSKSDVFVAALPQMVTDINTTASTMSGNATTCSTAATTCTAAQTTVTAAANAAQAAANAAPWTNKAYTANQCAISTVNFQTYRNKAGGYTAGVDPANDATNWVLLYGNDANGAFGPNAMVSPATIDLTLGNYFTSTVNGAVTLAINNCPATGYSFTWEVTLTSGSIALPASVKLPSDAMPTLSTAKTHLFMFVTSNGGTRWRLTIAPNYTT